MCFLVLVLAIPIAPGCGPVEAAESYVAILPKVLHSGSTEAVSLSLSSGDRFVRDRIEVALLEGGKVIARGRETIDGKGIVEIDIPDVQEGEYEIVVKGSGFEERAAVRVEKTLVVFLETDKPIYKPGQTIRMRAITLNSELMPVSEIVTVEVQDAKGIKIFRSEVDTDEYGVASLDLPISSEPNLGTWKIAAVTDKGRTELDVKVERYVLPKYEVTVDLPREWFLVNEPIEGKVSSQYSFGKAVRGKLEIKASRYVGEWEEYATFSKEIDGEADFEIPPVGYVAGVPEAGGMGNVTLDITVKEDVTGYEETTNRLLTVTESPLNIQVIPEGSVFKPGLPFSFLIITETPDNRPVEAQGKAQITYLDDEFQDIKTDEEKFNTSKGKALLEIEPPKKAVALTIEAFAEEASASMMLESSYSPSGNFIHVEQTDEDIPQVGEEIEFRVYSTREAANFYYEVVSRDKIVFSSYTRSREITFETTPLMAPASRLLVYQILPNSEVAADYIPFKVKGEYPHDVAVEFSKKEARPGDELDIHIHTEGKARVGIAAVDKSVFILAENRLNLQQVFAELERLYMEPQVELHEVSFYPSITTRGPMEVFEDAGVVVLSNNEIPEGKEFEWEGQTGFWEGLMRFFAGGKMVEEAEMAEGAAPPSAPNMHEGAGVEGLVEVERIRQYFPETWLWEELTTGSDGKASLRVNVPDTITTWMLRAVAISEKRGLGMAEDELRAFQPFFLKIDMPYSVIRGEEFPVKVAIYNYLDQPQRILVRMEEADWFDLLDDPENMVEIGANNLGGAAFMIRPTKLGVNEVEVSARGQEAADAMIKTLIVEPEGIAREIVDNMVLSGGDHETVETFIPPFAVEDSGRVYLAVTSSFLTQTMEGLEELIQMPFGCGEQNMMMFAPDVYITKYLQESGQLKPEIMAKAEKLMITGYQRQLTYRRNDGSFSAFGQSDNEGSLWLTAFVLKAFSEAQELMYIDENLLDQTAAWITAHQNKDGSFDPVGFIHHQEILGGMQGKDALTAYTAIALLEAGEKSNAAGAIDYLEGKLRGMDDPYTLAITACALELGKSAKCDDAYDMLMDLAQEDEDGLYWGGGGDIVPGEEETRGCNYNRSATIENTAYATLALIKHGDAFNAARAAKWLVSRRNAYGGFGSTQDTVVALQALVEYSTGSRADVDLKITVGSGADETELTITDKNFDVLQVIELPLNQEVAIEAKGKGEAVAQLVRRFNVPEAEEEGEQILQVSVDYDSTEVEVDDMVTVSVELTFAPPIPMEAGMVVLDISVPTGFAPVTESIAEAIETDERLKRYEVAGRKVIFYIENMLQGDRISLSFKVKAMYPVKAKGVSSKAYSYYSPEIRSETLGEAITVG